jgi:hypothetical protein
MKFNKKIFVIATTAITISCGGVALAAPSIQQQIASYGETQLVKNLANNLTQIPGLPFKNEISGFLQKQLKEILGSDADKVKDGYGGGFNADNVAVKSTEVKAFSDAMAKQLGLTDANAKQVAETLAEVGKAKDGAIEADSTLKAMGHSAVINTALVQQLTKNTEVNRGMLNQIALNNGLKTQDNYRSRVAEAEANNMAQEGVPLLFNITNK